MDWTSGYVADIAYTFGYYTELNPLRIELAFLDAGLVAPAVGSACELGFGQGLSTNLHAAATGVAWHGTDFNPAQACYARGLAAAAGAGARLYDEGFAEFCQRPDLPDFDYICLHGIWSWISDANRHVIVDFVRRKLKLGGVLYISYNTQPGWAPTVPLRHLMSQYADCSVARSRGSLARVDGALAFTERLLALDPLYLRANPGIGERFAKLKAMDRHYLAHEYFNQHWLPMPFSEMAAWLQPTKLSYACSAQYTAHVGALNLSPAQHALLAEIDDPVFRETTRDFLLNQQFRKDYWVKGARAQAAPERSARLRALQVVLLQPRAEVKLKVAGARGEVSMNDDVYRPLLDALDGQRPLSVGRLEQRLAACGVTLGQILEALLLLSDTGALARAQEEAETAAARPACDRINRQLMLAARGGVESAHLASPVTGGGVAVARFEQLFLLARAEGQGGAAATAAFVWEILRAQGQALKVGGAALDGAAANLAELEREAGAFLAARLPLLAALGVA